MRQKSETEREEEHVCMNTSTASLSDCKLSGTMCTCVLKVERVKS